jgi:GNAT superfamily N-acetyltransferase
LSKDSVAAGLVFGSASPLDAGALARVHRESWRTTYAGILPLEVIARHAGRNTKRRGAAGSAPLAAQRHWIAERPGEGSSGFASCGPARAPIEGLDAEIYALYVLQSAQRRGIGRELVRAFGTAFRAQRLFRLLSLGPQGEPGAPLLRGARRRRDRRSAPSASAAIHSARSRTAGTTSRALRRLK